MTRIMNQHRRRDCNDNVIIVFLVSALIAAVAVPTIPVDAFLSSSSSSSSTATAKTSSTRVPWMTTTTTTSSTIAYFQSPYRPSSTSSTTSSSTELHMVFDFFKERSSEGIAQLSKLSDAASKGNIGQGLAEAASYTKVTNEAFADGLAKSRNRFLNNFDGLFGGSTATTQDELLEELQDVLLQADLGVATSDDIVNEVRSLALDADADEEAAAAGGKKNKEIVSREDLMSIMRGVLIETLDFEKKEQSTTATASTTIPATSSSSTEDDVSEDINTNDNISTTIAGASAIRFASKEDNIPTVLFVMGANGMGKTTTIGKLANRLRVEGNQKVLVAACDTFRAGAVEQLQMWADKAQVDLIGPSEKGGSTPTSIIADALDKAKAENYDTVLVDTAGRLSNNWELNEELVKMKEMIQEKLSTDPENKLNPDVPHEILLVLDAAQGRMALDSARVWNKELGLTGLILTKLDGSARGGSVVAISRDLDVPVKLIGVGEGIDDLKDVRIVYICDLDRREVLYAVYRLYYLCVPVLLSDTFLNYSFYHLYCCRCRCRCRYCCVFSSFLVCSSKEKSLWMVY
jgi:fused signal recognition particle receptor